jgi:hypothetical protein
MHNLLDFTSIVVVFIFGERDFVVNPSAYICKFTELQIFMSYTKIAIKLVN